MTTKKRPRIDRQELTDLVNAGWSSQQIADSIGVDVSTIQRHRKRHGLNTAGGAERKADRDTVKALVEQGLKSREIAQRLGIHEHSVSRIRAELGIAHEYRGKPMTPERLHTIEQMIEDGWSHEEIHRTEGADVTTLRKYFPGTAWTRDQISEHTRALRQLTPTHFNARPNKHRAEYRAQTHPYGATKHPGSTTTEATTRQHGKNGAQGGQNVRGGVNGYAA